MTDVNNTIEPSVMVPEELLRGMLGSLDEFRAENEWRRGTTKKNREMMLELDLMLMLGRRLMNKNI